MEDLLKVLQALDGLDSQLEKLDAQDPGRGRTMDPTKNTVDWDGKLTEMDGIIARLEKMRDGIEAAEPENVDWAAALGYLGRSVDALAKETAEFAAGVERESYTNR